MQLEAEHEGADNSVAWCNVSSKRFHFAAQPAPLPGAPCAFRSVLPAAPPPASAAPRERVVGALRVESVEERSTN